MKTQSLKSKAVKLTVLASTLALLASCAKSMDAQSSAEPETLAGNIVNGVNSTDAFQKENGVVGLVISSDDGEGICSGTLISRRIVLTAAHCLDTSSSNIRSIAVVFTQDVKKATKQNIRFGVKGRVHDAFLTSAGGPTAWNDIALLKLNEDAPADVKLARLPSLVHRNPVAVKMQLTQAGFGKTEASRYAESNSSGILRQVSGIEVLALVNGGKELQLKEDGKGSCNGDSGGPAYAKAADGKLTQVGVNSRGTNPDNCIGVGIFTNVASHLQWIQKNSAALMAATAPTVK